jgi:hypothetical protein
MLFASGCLDSEAEKSTFTATTPQSLQASIEGSIRGGPMALLRDIAMLLALEDVLIEAIWIDSKSNDLADLLSRGKYETIADRYPQLSYVQKQASMTPQSPGTLRSP